MFEADVHPELSRSTFVGGISLLCVVRILAITMMYIICLVLRAINGHTRSGQKTRREVNVNVSKMMIIRNGDPRVRVCAWRDPLPVYFRFICIVCVRQRRWRPDTLLTTLDGDDGAPQFAVLLVFHSGFVGAFRCWDELNTPAPRSAERAREITRLLTHMLMQNVRILRMFTCAPA